MKERAPAFQFYPRQFAGDDQVMGMDLEAIGAHILLMCAAAASPERCRIDAEEYAIRMRLRNPSDEAWQRIKKQLLAGAWKVSPDGKCWIQTGLERTFQKQKDFSEQQRERANSKWRGKDAQVMPDTCRTDAEPMPEGMPKVCSSSSSSSSNHTSPQTVFADAPAVLLDDTRNSKPTEAQIERLYSLYPRKRDKLDAKKAIRKAVSVVMAGDADHPALPLEEALDYLAQRVTLYARCVQGCDPNYLPYPASWFNAGSFWDDERDWNSKYRGKNTSAPQPMDYTLTPDEAARRAGLEAARTAGARN